MPNTPQSAFDSFIRDIEPSKTTKSRASQAHATLRDFLGKHETFGDVHVRTFLTGSYKRDTAVRPRKKGDDLERPDVDIVVVTNHSLNDSPAAVVELVYKTLGESYEVIRKQQRSVGIETPQADMDIVPIIEPLGEGGKLYIADRKLEEWIETNPPKHTGWTTEVNSRADGRYKPLVKMTKWWRRANATISNKPKGFVLECFAAECLDFTERHYGELFVGTFEAFVSKYASYIELGLVPAVPDPGVPGNSVTTGLSFAAFEGYYNKVNAHAELGRQALQEEDADKAITLWRQIFGDRFPKFGTAKKSTGLLASPSVASPLTFPNRPVSPNKPDGFA